MKKLTNARTSQFPRTSKTMLILHYSAYGGHVYSNSDYFNLWLLFILYHTLHLLKFYICLLTYELFCEPITHAIDIIPPTAFWVPVSSRGFPCKHKKDKTCKHIKAYRQIKYVNICRYILEANNVLCFFQSKYLSCLEHA